MTRFSLLSDFDLPAPGSRHCDKGASARGSLTRTEEQHLTGAGHGHKEKPRG